MLILYATNSKVLKNTSSHSEKWQLRMPAVIYILLTLYSQQQTQHILLQSTTNYTELLHTLLHLTLLKRPQKGELSIPGLLST